MGWKGGGNGQQHKRVGSSALVRGIRKKQSTPTLAPGGPPVLPAPLWAPDLPTPGAGGANSPPGAWFLGLRAFWAGMPGVQGIRWGHYSAMMCAIPVFALDDHGEGL